MNYLSETSRIKSFQISLGLLPVPENLLKAKPTYSKQDTPTTRYKFNMRDSYLKDKRSVFLGYIDMALKENILRCKDIMVFLLQKETELGQEMVLRSKNGTIISDRAFRTCVQQQKKVNGIVEKSVKDQIIEMHRSRFSYIEIISELKCSDRHLVDSLESIGVKVTKKDKKEIKKTFKK